jgi:hypothetical protein
MDWFNDLDLDKIPWEELIRINPAPFLEALIATLIANASAANKVHTAAVRATLSLAVYNLALQKDPALAERLQGRTVSALAQATQAIEAVRVA